MFFVRLNFSIVQKIVVLNQTQLLIVNVLEPDFLFVDLEPSTKFIMPAVFFHTKKMSQTEVESELQQLTNEQA